MMFPHLKSGRVDGLIPAEIDSFPLQVHQQEWTEVARPEAAPLGLRDFGVVGVTDIGSLLHRNSDAKTWCRAAVTRNLAAS